MQAESVGIQLSFIQRTKSVPERFVYANCRVSTKRWHARWSGTTESTIVDQVKGSTYGKSSRGSGGE
jgi:hypothetical protein